MRFVKMHGIGNDYVYIDCVRNPPPADPAALSRMVSDRHFGIGSDGLILVCPSDRADARMRMFNSDGSESEMCGNGLRCVAKFVYDKGIARKPQLTIETGRGVLPVDLEIKNDKVCRVRVNMGEPILKSAEIPTTLQGDPPVNARLSLGGVRFEATCVSMGNPHAVFFVGEDFFVGKRDLVAEFGPQIENHPAFPRRVNAHFVNLAILDAIAGTSRENEFFAADLPVTGVLFNNRSVVQFTEMNVIHTDARLEQRTEERNHGVHAFHTPRQGVMSGHRPTHVGVENFALDAFHIAFAKQVVHFENQIGIRHFSQSPLLRM